MLHVFQQSQQTALDSYIFSTDGARLQMLNFFIRRHRSALRLASEIDLAGRLEL